MKILFLDDDELRHNQFEEWAEGHDVWHVRTVTEALVALQERVYDVVFLDHDLGGKHFQPSDETSGYEVAKWIAENQTYTARVRDCVVVHSYNLAGAKNMVNALLDQPFDVMHAPFGPSLKKWLGEEGKR